MRKHAPACAVLAAAALLAGCSCPRLKSYTRPEHFRNFLELAAGEPVPDFQVRDINGDVWRLSDHFGKTIVLQFVSSTSPAFVASLNDFQREVLSRYQAKENVTFVYVFTTEAHPELLSAGRRAELEQDEYQFRRAAARRYYYSLRFKDGKLYNLSGLIPAATNVVLLIDEPGGTVGTLYGYGRGGTTNPTFLIGEKGLLEAKALSASDFLSGSGYLAGNLPVRIQAEAR